MPVDFLANAKPVKPEPTDFLANATLVAPASPAGLPAGMSLPVVPAAPVPAGLQGPPPPSPNGGVLAHLRSNFHSNTDEIPNPGNDAIIGAENVARSAVHGIGHLVAHPIDSFITGPGETILAGGATPYGTPIFAPTGNRDRDIANQQAEQQAQTIMAQSGKQMLQHPAYSAGQILGPLLLTHAIESGVTEVPRIMRGTGDLAQTLAAKNATRILDRGTTAAVRDARAGIDPGRAVLESGVGPTLTKSSLHAKIGNAANANGALLANAVERADANALVPRVKTADLRPAFDEPINSAIAVKSGPGGNLNTAPYETLRAGLENQAPGATAPLYGPNAPSEVLPSDIWKTIQNIDKNTRFHPDPEVESLNETNRDIRSNLRPFLEHTDPTIRPLSRRYAGLTSAGEAMERNANRPGTGFQGSFLHQAATNTPLNTTLNAGLFRAGGLLRRVGGAVADSDFAFSPRMGGAKPLQLESETIGNSPYGADYSRGGFSAREPIVPAAPTERARLPERASPGDLQPMIGVKSTQPPPLAEDFARTRIAPNRPIQRTLQPELKGALLSASRSPFMLPSEAGPGELQPMVIVKAPAPYPPLAEDFARERIQPTKFNGPPHNPFNLPRGLLKAPKPKMKKLSK